MAWGYPVSDCCLTASWTTLFSWGAKGTALVLVKVNGFPTSVYGLIQTSMGPTFVWNAFRLSYPSDCRGEGGGLIFADDAKWDYFFSLSRRPAFCVVTTRINRVDYGCLDALQQPRLIVSRSTIYLRLSFSFFNPIENFTLKIRFFSSIREFFSSKILPFY